jgi:signal transduction histidine kinase
MRQQMLVSLRRSAGGGSARRYAVAIVAVLLALLAKLLLNPLILRESPFLMFFAAVTAAAWYGGFGPGILATLLAAAINASFFLSPVSSFQIADTSSQLELAVFILEGAVISGFSGALWSARRQAEHAVHARDHFLAIAAHELKTPLTAILGYTQTLQRRLRLGAPVSERDQRVVQVIHEQAQRLHKLIISLLDLSRIHRGAFSIEHEPLDVAGLVRRIVEEIQPALEQHSIEYRGPDHPLIIEGDALRLEQVFQNLLHNAIKYSPHGGLIVVSVAQRDAHIGITVADQGIGIPEAARDYIFQRYFRADNGVESASGMGIGLYVVQEIVALHGGTVELTRATSEGSTFMICLPQSIAGLVDDGHIA